jgi:hypothetical protein
MGNGDDRRTIIDQSVTSHNQSGGITAHTVNVDGRIRRSMSGEFKAGLLRDLSRDRPVHVMGLNANTESMAFANWIHGFLQANGFQMLNDTATCHMFFEPPIFNVKISPGNGGKEWWIVVGPAE